jgi:photosystem II stability/assembly factor-like uncharacterized protein
MKIYSLAFLLLFQYPFTSPIPYSQQKLNKNKTGAVNVVFKSADGGQTWQDISEGLPENLQTDGLWIDDFLVNKNGLHLLAGENGIYHSKPNSTTPFWEKESSPPKQGSIAPGKDGIFAYNNNGQILQKVSGASVWASIYPNFQEGLVRTIFETASGTVFIGSLNFLFKSTNRGKTWKRVYNNWVIKLVESNGVLMAATENGILRSTDDGENWECVLNEGGVGITVESIKGGFAAITANTQLMARTVHVTYNDGETWESIDAGLPPELSIASIIEVGEYFFCGHPTGIFRSSDKGKTWKLLLPSIDNKVFNLFVSGKVIYAIPLNPGC